MTKNLPTGPLLTSHHNARIKDVLALRDRRARDDQGRYLVEGYRELLRACDANVIFESLYICPEFFLGEHEPELIARIVQAGSQCTYCSPTLFEKMSYRDRPDGLLAVGYQEEQSLSTFANRPAKAHPPFLIVAEAIEKPGNLGTILRSSDAAGVDGLFLCDACTDLYNPNVVRASVGTLFTVPIVSCSSEEAINYLKQHQIAIVAATPHAEPLFTEVDLRGPVAIVVGTEQLGLSAQWMQAATLTVRIPMLGVADSLNVATATTLLLYEVQRQRSQRSL